MQGFMISLLACSAAMSGLALLYMAAAPLLARRYAGNWLYYAWLAIAIGLIVPFRPQFGNALFRLELPSETVLPAIRAASGAPLFLPAENPAAAAVSSGSAASVASVASVASAASAASAASVASVASAIPANISWWQAAFAIWLSGAALFLACRAMQHWRFAKMAARWGAPVEGGQAQTLLRELKAEMGISRRIGLHRCSCVSAPMLIGLAAPRILLPDCDFAADDLRFILKHELAHYARKDLWHKCLVLLATAMHWFNPVAYLIAKAAAAQCEISCDALVLGGADFERRRQYGEAIIRIAGIARNGAKLRTALSTNFYGGKRSMKNRISSIMDTKRKKTGVAILCLAVAGIIATGSAFATTAAADRAAVGSAAAIAMGGNQTGQISVDGGQTWIDGEEYLKLHPGFEGVVWWTHGEYEEWLDGQREILPNLIGGTYGYYDEKGALRKEAWTREKVDEAILRYEQTLEDIKNGAKVSKFADGGENANADGGENADAGSDENASYANAIGYVLNPSEPISASYSAEVSLGNGNVKNLGAFDTEKERLAAVEAFCGEQIKAGQMTRQEADKILSEYK